MANPNTPPFGSNPQETNVKKNWEALSRKPNQVADMIEKIRPVPRGQNDKVLETTRQGRTMKSLKPQCPPNKGVIY